MSPAPARDVRGSTGGFNTYKDYSNSNNSSSTSSRGRGGGGLVEGQYLVVATGRQASIVGWVLACNNGNNTNNSNNTNNTNTGVVVSEMAGMTGMSGTMSGYGGDSPRTPASSSASSSRGRTMQLRVLCTVSLGPPESATKGKGIPITANTNTNTRNRNRTNTNTRTGEEEDNFQHQHQRNFGPGQEPSGVSVVQGPSASAGHGKILVCGGIHSSRKFEERSDGRTDDGK